MVLCYMCILSSVVVLSANNFVLSDSIGPRCLGSCSFLMGLHGLGLLLGPMRTLATPGVNALGELGWPLLGPASVTVDRLFRRLTLNVPCEVRPTTCLASRVG